MVRIHERHCGKPSWSVRSSQGSDWVRKRCWVHPNYSALHSFASAQLVTVRARSLPSKLQVIKTPQSAFRRLATPPLVQQHR